MNKQERRRERAVKEQTSLWVMATQVLRPVHSRKSGQKQSDRGSNWRSDMESGLYKQWLDVFAAMPASHDPSKGPLGCMH